MASFENFDDDRDQIYISGLPRDVTEEQLAAHFGQIGTIKMDKKKRPPTPKARIGVHAVAGTCSCCCARHGHPPTLPSRRAASLSLPAPLATPQIWLYRDKATGQLKGDATITYEDPYAASQAPSWFDGKEFMGK